MISLGTLTEGESHYRWLICINLCRSANFEIENIIYFLQNKLS